MIKTLDEIIVEVKDYIGEDNSDSAISLLEDITDTIVNALENSNEEEINKRVEETENFWRNKYIERFNNPESKEDEEIKEDEEEIKEDETIEKLFD